MTQLAKLLVVDDNRDVAEMLAEVLEIHGHEVRRADNGLEGLELLHEDLPDLVILDVEMPQLTGPEMACRMLVEDAGMERVPVLLVSGVVNLCETAARVGTPYALGKPFAVDRLLTLVDEALRERIGLSPNE